MGNWSLRVWPEGISKPLEQIILYYHKYDERPVWPYIHHKAGVLKRSRAYQSWIYFPHKFFGHKVVPESPPLPVLLDSSQTGSVTVHAVHLEVSFTVAFDQRSRDQSHESDCQELGKRPPREDVVQGGDLWEYGARTNTDEVVWNQTWMREQQVRDLFFFSFALCVCLCYAWSHLWTQRRRK